jgi:hypothetical protein
MKTKDSTVRCESERREKVKALHASDVQSVLELYCLSTCISYVLRSFGLEVQMTGLRTVGLWSSPVRPESVGPVCNPRKTFWL